MENQLTIMAESLEKKIRVLEKIAEYNKLQEQAFTDGQMRMEDFDRAVEEKGKLIAELTRLDEGFETMYERLATQLKDHKEQYAQQIRRLQELITRVTDLNVSIQAQELRNKQLVEQFFAKERAGIRQSRKSSKAAYDYYKGLKNNSYSGMSSYDTKK